jgi:hypothetical protein
VADVVNDSIEVDPVLIGSAADESNQSRLPAVDFPEESDQPNNLLLAVAASSSARWLVPVFATLGIITISIASALWWLSNQWFVGVYTQSKVVSIFQGVPAGGMYRLVEVSNLSVSQLPEFEYSQVYQTFESANLEDAQAAVARLQKSADLCELLPSSPGCPQVTP